MRKMRTKYYKKYATLQSVHVYGSVFLLVKYNIHVEKPPVHNTPEIKKERGSVTGGSSHV